MLKTCGGVLSIGALRPCGGRASTVRSGSTCRSVVSMTGNSAQVRMPNATTIQSATANLRRRLSFFARRTASLASSARRAASAFLASSARRTASAFLASPARRAASAFLASSARRAASAFLASSARRAASAFLASSARRAASALAASALRGSSALAPSSSQSSDNARAYWCAVAGPVPRNAASSETDTIPDKPDSSIHFSGRWLSECFQPRLISSTIREIASRTRALFWYRTSSDVTLTVLYGKIAGVADLAAFEGPRSQVWPRLSEKRSRTTWYCAGPSGNRLARRTTTSVRAAACRGRACRCEGSDARRRPAAAGRPARARARRAPGRHGRTP